MGKATVQIAMIERVFVDTDAETIDVCDRIESV